MRACICFAMVFFLLGICRTTEADYTGFQESETISGQIQKKGAIIAEVRLERAATWGKKA